MKELFFHFSSCNSNRVDIDRNVWGAKGTRLVSMVNSGFPIPPGFILGVALSKIYIEDEDSFHDMSFHIRKELHTLQKVTNKKFLCPKNPLIISVRSGSSVSMPGMMDTILNVGLTRDSLYTLDMYHHSPCAVLDIYRRFLFMYATTVLHCDSSFFFSILSREKSLHNIKRDHLLSQSSLEKIIDEYELIIKKDTKGIPLDPYEQVFESIKAVFISWNSSRAIHYRMNQRISHDLGTSAIVQTMVFGNISDTSGTGVAFTRDPSDGENIVYGEFLDNAQGEDIVAGTHMPFPLTKKMKKKYFYTASTMEDKFPNVFCELCTILKKLETKYGWIQDVEFTIENGRLWILQSRDAKLNTNAFFIISLALLQEKKATIYDVFSRIDLYRLHEVLHKRVIDEGHIPVAKGLPASPGAVYGAIVFDVLEAKKLSQKNTDMILVRPDTSPDDIEAMTFANGIITSCGGLTSHAAVVTRGMGKPCICGVNFTIDVDKRNISLPNGDILTDQDNITMDGKKGHVYLGRVPIEKPQTSDNMMKVLNMSKKITKIKVLANADSVEDMNLAFSLGADGIGLCRTEHMFFHNGRIPYIQAFLLGSESKSHTYLDNIFNYQKKDFMDIFSHSRDKCTIRLLDPPLHEFLPSTQDHYNSLSHIMGITASEIEKKSHSLRQKDSMMGMRGARIGILYPEIYKMQIKSIIEAQKEVIMSSKNHYSTRVEVMIPFICCREEIIFFRDMLNDICRSYTQEKYSPKIYFGAMIETPRFAYIAHTCADICDFFSFGTNDLTQMIYGISRDDASFMFPYIDSNIFTCDPFSSLDEVVGNIVHNTSLKIKEINPQCSVSICGEHAGHLESLQKIFHMPIDYVSCSPYRVPLALCSLAHCQSLL